MIFLDYDKVLVQLWQATEQSQDQIKKLKQSGKLIDDIPPDSFLWTGTAKELDDLLKTIEQAQQKVCPSETTA